VLRSRQVHSNEQNVLNFAALGVLFLLIAHENIQNLVESRHSSA
jgi:hypothetical protein